MIRANVLDEFARTFAAVGFGFLRPSPGGTPRSAAPGADRVHNGAMDNASGIATLLEAVE